MEKKIIVAIDGHSSCGKSTMAKSLARRHGYIYIDTGAMYRAVALHALRNGCFADGCLKADALLPLLGGLRIDFCHEGPAAGHILLNGEDVEKEIRGLEVSNAVSPVAAVPEVRTAMVALQRQIAGGRGVVMDGRDIGTVVFPDAELKIFVTAEASVRAQRRFAELQAKGQPAAYEDILRNVEMRDRIDTERSVSPLRPAADAIILDNSHMTLQEQDEWAEKHFHEACR